MTTTNAQPTVRLRASLAPLWLECSAHAAQRAMATFEPDPNAPIEVATEFGNQVHAVVTGHKSVAPARILYDEHTPTERVMGWQVKDAVEAANEALAGLDGRVVRREAPLSARVSALGVDVLVTATLDLVVELNDPPDTVDLFDLKTGRMDQRSAFAQMAICAFLAEASDWNVRDVVLLHVPRARTEVGGYQQSSQLLRRPAKPLVDDARAIVRLVALAAQGPIASPGLHCHRCEVVDCIYHPEKDDVEN